tara:strand:- start:159 stop:635 length:477 start_codon:yes stop_codon:yes gene_type:complete
MPDYSKAKIYKIVCDITGETYYGSTTQPLWLRMGKHRSKENRCFSKQIIERGNYSYSLVEEYSCENKEQLCRRERFYIENNICVNKQIPNRTITEWYNDNRDKKADYCKTYYQDNKEKLNHNSKNYYNQLSKERINERQREYRAKKKEEKLKASVSTD